MMKEEEEQRLGVCDIVKWKNRTTFLTFIVAKNKPDGLERHFWGVAAAFFFCPRMRWW